ncbi:MAG TPA: TIGR03118 family protein [Saprospiraceae bacterium]|nr:TIGR03118 family protein [Saprospiraceae bacterium]
MTNVQDDKVKKGYEVTNLVADVAGYDAAIIDSNLVNAWGIALSPTGVFWISAEGTHLSTIYNDEGMALRAPVTMDGAPTGQVFNFSTGYIVGTGPARFIFVTEDGKITAWRTGNTAPTIIDDSDEGASYTGAELAMNGGEALLYVANVAGGEIEVYDGEWNELEDFGFEDPSLPDGASPFNIQLVNGQLYVTYVMPDGGLVNVFNTNGDFVRRFATGGTLDAPWGITNVPPEFGLGQAIIVGNFGDGRINVYNKNGNFKGQLADEEGDPIVIDGLWDLVFKPGAFDGTSEVDLYFTAGPDNETHGIFGEIEFELAEEE